MLKGVAYRGDAPSFERLVEAAHHSDLANFQAMLQDFYVTVFSTPEAESVFSWSASFQTLKIRVRARLDDLRRRYVPLVGLSETRR